MTDSPVIRDLSGPADDANKANVSAAALAAFLFAQTKPHSMAPRSAPTVHEAAALISRCTPAALNTAVRWSSSSKEFGVGMLSAMIISTVG